MMKTNNVPTRDIILEKECWKLSHEKACLLDFLYLAAASKTSNGDFNNSRESLREKANALLDEFNL
jgi:hypothetical protein